jgi:hypothetical protein
VRTRPSSARIPPVVALRLTRMVVVCAWLRYHPHSLTSPHNLHTPTHHSTTPHSTHPPFSLSQASLLIYFMFAAVCWWTVQAVELYLRIVMRQRQPPGPATPGMCVLLIEVVLWTPR